MKFSAKGIHQNPAAQAVSPGSLAGKLGFHYGWIIVAVSACLIVSAGFAIQAVGIVFTYLHDHLGWDPAQIALGGSLFFLAAALVSPLIGIITDRHGAVPAAAAGVGLTLLGVLIIGAASEVWHFWVGYGIFLGLAFTCIRIATAVAVNEWFQHRLGVAVGVLQASFAAGPAAMILVFSLLLENLGLRAAVWSLGLAGCAGMAVLMLLYRSRPSDMEIRAYGAEKVNLPSLLHTGPVRDMRASAFWNHLKRSGTFWNLTALHCLGCIGHVIVLVYIVPAAEHSGIGHVAAAGILSVLTAVSAVSRFCAPIVADRLASKWVIVSIMLLQGLPVVALFWADALWQFYLVAVIFGLGFGGETPIMLVFTRKYFGSGPMGRPLGCFEISDGLAVSLGLWLAGALFGAFDSHSYVLALAIGCSLAGAALAASLGPVLTGPSHEWEKLLPLEARSRDFFNSLSVSQGVRATG